MTNEEIGNRANVSGRNAEERIENFLIREGKIYKRARTGQKQIDFIINPNSPDTIYADSKSHNVRGTCDEKIPHCSWKYARHYDTDEIYIIRGECDFRPEIYEQLEEQRKLMGITTIVMTEKEFYMMLLEMEEVEGEFF